MPDHNVSCCTRGAAEPDVQALAHSDTNSAVIANRPAADLPYAVLRAGRERKRDDVGVTEPLPAKRDYTGTVRARPLANDN